MERLKAKITCMVCVIVCLIIIIPLKCFAIGNIDVSISATNVNIGDTFTVTVTSNNVAGTYSVSANNSNVVITSNQTGFLDNNSETWTFKASNQGTSVITIKTIDMTDYDNNNVQDIKTFTVTVKAPSTPTPTPTPEQPQELEFTTLNETVYATDTVNIRASYNSESEKIGTLEKGDSVKRIGESTSTSEGYKWSKVIYNGKACYVISSRLSTEKPEEENNSEPSPEEAEGQSAQEDNNEDKTTVTTESGDGLSKLQIEGLELSPQFSTNTHDYTIKLKEDLATLNIQTETTSENYEVVIVGNSDLKDGENLINIIVYDEKNNVIAIYQITVLKNTFDQSGINSIFNELKQEEKLKTIVISSILFLILVLIIIYIIISIKIKKNRKELSDDELPKAIKENDNNKDDKEEKKKLKEKRKKEKQIEEQDEGPVKEKKKGKHF